MTRNNTPGLLLTTEGEQTRPRPSTVKAPKATSEGEKKRSREEEIDWTLTEAEKEQKMKMYGKECEEAD